MFIYGLNDPQVVYVAEEDGFVYRIDLRSKTQENIFTNQINNAKASVKALLQAPVLGSHALLVGGSYSYTIGMIDVRRPGHRDAFVRTWHPSGISPLVDAHGLKPFPIDSLSFDQDKRAEEYVSVSGLALSSSGRSLLVNYQHEQIYAFSLDLSPSKHPSAATHAYFGHDNCKTFLKTASYFGPNDEYVVAGR